MENTSVDDSEHHQAIDGHVPQAQAVVDSYSSDLGDSRPSRIKNTIIISSNIFTQDISKDFHNAVSHLPVGSLIKDEAFTLFEAVGALEIGDPKMDSGCLEDGEALEELYDVTKDLKPEELLWIMDQLVAREVAWLMGYPLSQTLFTSLYIDRLLWPEPMQLSEAHFHRGVDTKPLAVEILRIFCLCLIKSCDFILQMVTSQHYYEEEDFATQLFNRDLLSKFDTDEILSLVENIATDLECSSLVTRAKQWLHTRLMFQAEILRMLKSHSIQSCLTTDQHQRIGNLLVEMRDSSGLGVPIPDSFNSKIQRRLASTVPPRPMVAIDLDSSWSFWQRLLQDSVNAFEVLGATNTEDLMTAYTVLGAQTPQPSSYVRALLQSFLGYDAMVCGHWTQENLVIEDLKTLSLPASPMTNIISDFQELNVNERSEIVDRVQDFCSKFSQTFINFYRTFCLNRCRTRRTLCHAAAEWDQIQAEVEGLDEILQNLIHEPALKYPPSSEPTFSYGMSSWVYHYKLTQLRLIIQTGFELSVYAPYELPDMYWYLSQLCDIHMSHLERISFFVSKRQEYLQQKLSQDSKLIQQCKDTLSRLYRHFAWLKATHSMSLTIHHLFTLLQRYGHFRQPTSTYSSDKLRFEIRMRPFLGMSIPEPPTFDDIRQQSIMQHIDNESIHQRGISFARASKKAWEEILKNGWKYRSSPNDGGHSGEVEHKTLHAIEKSWNNDIKGAVKASIAANIAFVTLSQKVNNQVEHNSDSKVVVVLPNEGDKDFWHLWWKIPRIS